MPGYFIKGYDKDADVYEAICTTPLSERAMQIAKAVLQYHLNVEELRRVKTGEPFDWFVVTDNDGNVIRTFTEGNPEGLDT